MASAIEKKKSDPVTTYHERKIGNTLYRVTSVFLGEIELGKAIEDLTVRRILERENASQKIGYSGSQI